jgi:outer membrane protein OmpA-like peptidoglycan-associated protein
VLRSIGGHGRTRGVAVALGALAALGLAACTTINPYTGEQQTSTLAKGAGIGAAVGAVAGWISGDDSKASRRRAVIGAGVGALAGGSIGYYMDVQEAKLREQLRGTGVGVTRVGNEITLNMPGNVTFASDSADLNPGFFGVLDSVGVVLKQYDKTVIEVAGHTDSTGSHEHNQSLSERRAATVGTYLERRGVLKTRIVTIGAGETRPIASNDSVEGRARNRRVELTLSPLSQAAG